MINRSIPVIYTTDLDGNITKVITTMGDMINSGWWRWHGKYNGKPIMVCPGVLQSHNVEYLGDCIDAGRVYPFVFDDGEVYKGKVIGVTQPKENQMENYVFFKEEADWCVVYTLADD